MEEWLSGFAHRKEAERGLGGVVKMPGGEFLGCELVFSREKEPGHFHGTEEVLALCLML